MSAELHDVSRAGPPLRCYECHEPITAVEVHTEERGGETIIAGYRLEPCEHKARAYQRFDGKRMDEVDA